MPRAQFYVLRLALIVVVFVAGAYLWGTPLARLLHRPAAEATFAAPLPHHLPPHVGGLSFRFAMVHDVVHERYPKHGPAYYKERERLARQQLAKLRPETREALDLRDDIGAGLNRVGKHQDAVQVLQEKLALQNTHKVPESERYTTYANLGTFLVDANLPAMLQGDMVACTKVEEGRAFIAKAMEVNPNAHFGREIWQRQFIDFLLQAQATPTILKQRDFISNALLTDEKRDEAKQQLEYMRSRVDFSWKLLVHNRAREGQPIDAAFYEDNRDRVRKGVYLVGPKETPHSGGTIPFDEPMLGIIGMWRAGGGANPHFALCMAETMRQLGQRHLAWSCYERAQRLAADFWPTPAEQDFLRQYCVACQQDIEATFAPADRDKLRSQFDRELARGQKYQREYQEYVATKLGQGTTLDAPEFYDDFHKTHPRIASKPGPEEWYVGIKNDHTPRPDDFATGLLGGGLAVAGFALAFGLVRYVLRRSQASA